MIDTIATRDVTLNGQDHVKGAKVRMPLQQFEDLEPTGMFERAPVTKAAPKKKSAAASAAPAQVAAEPARPTD